jgi:hypothetical protein
LTGVLALSAITICCFTLNHNAQNNDKAIIFKSY